MFLSNRSAAIFLGPGNQSAPYQPAHQTSKFRLSGRMPATARYLGLQAWLTTPFKIVESDAVWRASQKQRKVQCDDLQNEDGCGNLEELQWMDGGVMVGWKEW
ncbi:hypothetical protein NE237_033016 [Protea cynaroides]|uniref:Uncharacterized protein n=1 Tax=Protea cynaroides TaxID=273540 RepID=A0A9Q0L5K0_9MAGN|nr:hypothetical protein NE237_033016 [Protea cynaroides]